MKTKKQIGSSISHFYNVKWCKSHDTVHETARHGKAFEGLLKRYFG
ncbi:MAG: hypothetical protein K2I10_01275 [Lachnospiraceae bacterium]|nr:hypothetical protein [Lachnospiraceae bacterium]